MGERPGMSPERGSGYTAKTLQTVQTATAATRSARRRVQPPPAKTAATKAPKRPMAASPAVGKRYPPTIADATATDVGATEVTRAALLATVRPLVGRATAPIMGDASQGTAIVAWASVPECPLSGGALGCSGAPHDGRRPSVTPVTKEATDERARCGRFAAAGSLGSVVPSPEVTDVGWWVLARGLARRGSPEPDAGMIVR